MNKVMSFLMKEEQFNNILNQEFKNPEIIKLAKQLGEFQLDGYTFINANRVDKNKKRK